MLVDIFSSFDDHNFVFMNMSINLWLCTLLIINAFNMMFWLPPNRWSCTLLMLTSVIKSQLMRSTGLNLEAFINIITGLFTLLVFLNLLSLFPYIFSSTSHLAISVSLGFPLWLSLIMSGTLLNLTSTAAKLLPEGAPAMLSPFLVLVETVSICVRPLTLSIRLVANMSAGHIVLGLVGTYLSANLFFPSMALILLMFIQIFYSLFEFGVALIQAYIFCLLITLYSDDHPTEPWLIFTFKNFKKDLS